MTNIARQRARSIDEFRAGQLRFVSAARGAYEAAPLRPFPSDVIISPFGKSGTTMLQQIFHTLRTRGDTDFDDISRVVPWIEMGPILGLDLNAPQKAGPRGFKSHLSYTAIPKGGRYIVPLRDPKDAFVSMYRFMEGWFLEPGAVPMEDFFEGWQQGGGPEGEDYWAHLKSWWAVKDQPNVLLLSYSRMVRDPVAHIRRIAEFAGIPLDEELLALTIERSSRAWMLAHKGKFDDKLMRELSETKGGLPPGSDSAKVRAGDSGRRQDELPPELAARMDDIWEEQIAGPLGFANFAEFEEAL
jgi:hypothetical protein